MCTILKNDSPIQNILSAFSKVLGAKIYTTDQSLFLILHYRLIPPSPFSWFWRLLILEIEPFAFDSFYGSAILQFRLVPIQSHQKSRLWVRQSECVLQNSLHPTLRTPEVNMTVPGERGGGGQRDHNILYNVYQKGYLRWSFHFHIIGSLNKCWLFVSF